TEPALVEPRLQGPMVTVSRETLQALPQDMLRETLSRPDPTSASAPAPPESAARTHSEPASERSASTPAAGQNALELSNLSADIAIGRVRMVMLAALASPRDCDAVGETLIGDALRRGLSVVRIDAGSGRLSTEPGLTDLAADRASFGD